MRKVSVFTGAVLVAASLAALAGPASASCTPAPTGTDVCSGTTTVSFTVGTVGILSIATTPTAVLTSNGTAASGTLGVTTITDLRTGTVGYSVNASTTAFTQSGGSIAATAATLSLPAIPAVGAPLVTAAAVGTTPAITGAATSYPLSTTSALLFSVTSSAGSTVTYTPSLSVTLGTAPNGVYTGTITQSVS